MVTWGLDVEISLSHPWFYIVAGGGGGVRVKGGRVRGSKKILENSVKTWTLNAALHAMLCTWLRLM